MYIHLVRNDSQKLKTEKHFVILKTFYDDTILLGGEYYQSKTLSILLKTETI